MGDVFKALADPTRRAILDELTERDGQTLFEICARLTTRHLRKWFLSRGWGALPGPRLYVVIKRVWYPTACNRVR
ncbi:transcriptional regulator [Mycolicibacterium thermoresistibile]|uniref:Transcriptional regulator n=1 Tax=Mycolicibacterium thermoresistibile TaxID=1797 RepID=A0A100XD14_MYCTH|nr:transcriptional regulator [Mycolicibacterium thermoresistibile]